MNSSYNKIRHIRESNFILEQRKLQETSLIKEGSIGIDLQTIVNGLLTFVKLMVSNIPYVKLALILKWIYENKDKDIINEIKQYSQKIDAELEKNGLKFKTQDVINNLSQLKNNIYVQLKKEYDNLKNKMNPFSL